MSHLLGIVVPQITAQHYRNILEALRLVSRRGLQSFYRFHSNRHAELQRMMAVGNRGLCCLTPAGCSLQGSLSSQLQNKHMYTKDTIQPELYLYSGLFVHRLTVSNSVPHCCYSSRVDFIASAQPDPPFVCIKKRCTKKSILTKLLSICYNNNG
jgi:hypothetical protein